MKKIYKDFVFNLPIDKNTPIRVESGGRGGCKYYTIIDAVLFEPSFQQECMCFVLLENNKYGEEDMVIAQLTTTPLIIERLDHTPLKKTWLGKLHQKAIFIPASNVLTNEVFGDIISVLEEEFDLDEERLFLFTDEEINRKK